MSHVYRCLNERKHDIDQEYYSLIEDFKKYINISKLRDEAIRTFYQKLSQIPLTLPEYNADDLRLKIERTIPDVIFFNLLINFMKRFPLIFCFFLPIKVSSLQNGLS
jgi:hypothetical protein